MTASKRKVLVAMSGGVDSSVCAGLLVEQGYDVIGCFMRLGSDDSVEKVDTSAPVACSTAKPGHQGCCSVNDAQDARMVAGLLGIPFYVLNFRKDFGKIIDYFVSEYNAGRTPNPCVRCNDWLKFGKLLDYARSVDADYVATGHYARVDQTHPDGPRILRGMDTKKDQSYVLFGIKRQVLPGLMLPIGEMTKPVVRAHAERMGLPIFAKPDSQEICFVPDNDYAGLVKRRTPEKVTAGVVLDTQGNALGEHPGHQHFTIGQRRGLGVAKGVPLYVIQRDPVANTIVVGDKESLFSSSFTADQTNWMTDLPVGQPIRCQMKIRYNSQPVQGTLVIHPDGTVQGSFDQPVSAVTPGQAAVFYQDDQLLGGGWISSVQRASDAA